VNDFIRAGEVDPRRQGHAGRRLHRRRTDSCGEL